MAEKVRYMGVGFLDILTVLFVGLKLGKVIDWSWWQVLLPSLIGWGLVVIFGVVALILVVKAKGYNND